MAMCRIGTGLAVVSRLLYVVGGYDGQSRLSTVECYHPEDNSWTMMAPMIVTRSGAGQQLTLSCITVLSCRQLLYILAYKLSIFGSILTFKLWGSAYTRVMPHSQSEHDGYISATLTVYVPHMAWTISMSLPSDILMEHQERHTMWMCGGEHIVLNDHAQTFAAAAAA